MYNIYFCYFPLVTEFIKAIFFLSLRGWRDYPSDCYCFFGAVEAREGWGQVEFIETKFT